MPQVWETQGWIQGPKIEPAGQQSHTFYARRASDSPDQFPFVLKRLKRKDDIHRRRRMYREVVSLRVLDGLSGVSQLVDSNAETFGAIGQELYLVTERIFGIDLQELVVADGPLSVDVAVKVINSALGTLRECHRREVLHRDLKPCHVVLRNREPTDPVVLDFGLAFNVDDKEGVESLDAHAGTRSDEGIGNRFIILPEQMGDGPDKRDFRSDISQMVGIFFWAVAGLRPGLLRDGSSRKPHERLPWRQKVNGATDDGMGRLQRIFDIGFEYEPGRRWQSIDDLCCELTRVIDPSHATDERPLHLRLQRLQERLTSSVGRTALARFRTLADAAHTHIVASASQVGQQFQGHLKISPYAQQHEGDRTRLTQLTITDSLRDGNQFFGGVTNQSVQAALDRGMVNVPLRLKLMTDQIEITARFETEPLYENRVAVHHPDAEQLVCASIDTIIEKAMETFVDRVDRTSDA